LDLGNLDWAIRLTFEEHTDEVLDEDIAVNMSRGIDPYVQDLMTQREKVVNNLSQLKEKLSNRDAKEREGKASKSKA
jgi:AAA+ superfamily predicted ATPase